MAHWLVALAALDGILVPARVWLERLAVLVPGPGLTRWLLLADAACLIAIALGARRPVVAVPLALGGGFLALNVIGMAVRDFFLALALFHLAVGIAATLALGRLRWLGAGTVVLALALGALT
jgi:hypothetical protein